MDNNENTIEDNRIEFHNPEDENITSDNPGANVDPKESKLKQGLDIFGCLFALNICFVISIIPVFTI